MYYKLNNEQEADLLKKPETGMGYQIVEAYYRDSETRQLLSGAKKTFIALNSEIVIEINGSEGAYIRNLMSVGIRSFSSSAKIVILSDIRVLNEKQYRNIIHASSDEKKNGATDNPVKYANGEEIFVRLSPFEDDRRVDKVNKCLLPGSFSTTHKDYMLCKKTNDDPVERYALPSNDEIKFAFYIQPLSSDTLQRGMVQPLYGKRGGGEEAFFERGTAKGTFFNESPY